MSDNNYIKIADQEAYAEFEYFRSDNTGGATAFLTVGWLTDDMDTERIVTVSPEEALQIGTLMIEYARRERACGS